jgi:hypothetical protein
MSHPFLIDRPRQMSDGDFAQDHTTPEDNDAPTNGEIAAAQLAALLDAFDEIDGRTDERGDYIVISVYRWQDFQATVEEIRKGVVAA